MGFIADQLRRDRRRLAGRLRLFRRKGRAPIWYDPAYRLPVPASSVHLGIEARRADFVVWSLLDLAIAHPSAIRTPHRVRHTDVARVHTCRLMESLYDPVTLARIVAADAHDLPLDEVIRTFRLATGGTVAASRCALQQQGPTLNLLGGFHHAEPDKAGGLCPINDIAIAAAALRADGFRGQINVVDLDAHPPDGTAACLKGDDKVWIGSLSGSDWGPLEGDVDETVLPEDCDDWTYLKALDALLRRMPEGDLTFVIAGGDVLKGDKLGKLGMSLKGARRRDRRVLEALIGQASVWLPGGGYHAQSWQVLLGTAMVIEGAPTETLPRGYDPMNARFTDIAQALDPDNLEGEQLLTEADLAELFGGSASKASRVLGYYTPEGIEYALFRYGVTGHLRRLGFRGLRVETSRDTTGDRARVFGTANNIEHLLIEFVVEKQELAGRPILYVHWLTMMNPLAHFPQEKTPLPGQEHPGLGLAKEAGVMFAQMARRQGLKGLAYRPAWYHVAYAGRKVCRFVDPQRQGRFEAMMRDLAQLPLAEATQAVSEGRVLLNGEPYQWEADYMVHWLIPPEDDRDAVAAERKRVQFTVVKAQSP